MTTLHPPLTNQFPEDSLEKKVYTIVENLSEYLPIANDRNRLGFNLYRFMKGEGDPPSVIVKSNKLTVNVISLDELADRINNEINKIKSGS